MKKIILVALVSMFVLMSCKKDYTCNCVGDVGSVTYLIENSSKSDAEETCTGTTTAIVCELK